MTSNSVVFLNRINDYIFCIVKNFLNYVFCEYWYDLLVLFILDEVKRIHDVMVEAGKAAGKLIIENAGTISNIISIRAY